MTGTAESAVKTALPENHSQRQMSRAAASEPDRQLGGKNKKAGARPAFNRYLRSVLWSVLEISIRSLRD
jgi:hypothetical protein